MAEFYIKSITAYGKGKKPSAIELTSGLNIICGPSNTGKSYVVECIDYMFGGSKKPFDESTGYDRIVMVVEFPNSGSVSLERQFGKSKTKVFSSVPNIESGDYGNGKSELKLSDLWLSMIGVKEEHKIITNERFETHTLTWRTFVHSFLIKEDNIIQKPSIIEDARFAAKTASLSALLFLINGLDYHEFIPQEKQEIKEAKKAAVVKYINKELTRLSERKGVLSDNMLALGTVDVERAIQSIIDEIASTEEQITLASKRSQTLLESIYEVSAKLEECDLLKDRYKALESQYLSDIKRLSFITDGEAQRAKVPENKKCPFCDSDLQEHEHTSVVKASQGEQSRIISQLKDLRETQQDIVSESSILEAELSRLHSENTGVVELINKKLTPRANELRQSLSSYRAVVQIQNELDVIHRLAAGMNAELFEMETEEESQAKYKPKEQFDSEVLEGINKYLNDALVACAYENLVSSRLSLDSFDVVVNGYRKDSFGKGFRAFLNTVLAFTLMKYLALHGKYAPKLLILDSPILSLKERGSEKATDSMKSSLFRYLINSQKIGQIIVVENDIPDLDYSSANVISFTMDTEKGRYGFLDGVYN